MLVNNIIKIEESTLLDNATFRAYGFKHAIVGIMAASVLHPNTDFVIDNVPKIDDVYVLCNILKKLGAEICMNNYQLTINTKKMDAYSIERALCIDVHGVIYLLPSLLARFDKAELYECGGCQIGDVAKAGKRPISHMLSVLKQFGFVCDQVDDKLIGKRVAYHDQQTIDIMHYSDDLNILTGPQISGATKTAILAAMSVNRAKTLIKNPYRKPDVTELIRLMRLLNYDVSYDENELFINRTKEVDNTKEVHFTLINDLSEVMTYICLAVFHNINAEIQQVNIELLQNGLAEEFKILKAMGVNLIFEGTSIKIPKVKKLQSVNIDVTSVGIYSDHQPFFAVLMSLANGESSISEYVWKNRFSYAYELKKLGFNIDIGENSIRVSPNAHIHGEKTLVAQDLRAAAVLLIVALKAKGTTLLQGGHHLSRGYENLQQSLINCGAKLTCLT